MCSTDRSLLRDTRGSATTEGVIIAFFMAIVFGGVIYAYRGYRDEARSVRAAAAPVWPKALQGCDDGPREHELRSRLGGYEATAFAVAPNEADQWDEIRARDVAGSDHRSIEAGPMFGGRRNEFDEQARTACNPVAVPPPDLDPDILELFCDRHPDPRWPEGCHLVAGPAGE
jgi:hypothetical protein